MSTRDLRVGLGQAERVYDEASLTADADRRIRERLQPKPAQRRWRFAIPMAALAAAAIVLLLVRSHAHAPATLGGLQIVASTADLHATEGSDESVQVTEGGCTLFDADQGITVVVADHARVRKEKTGIRIVAGVAEIQVRKRPANGPPAQVLVSHGAIQIVGTKFRVEQSSDGGRVVLHEGKIRFVAPDGRTVTLAPGDSLAWPIAEPAPVPPAPVAPPPAVLAPHGHGRTPPPSEAPPSELSPDDAEAVLREVAVERSRGEYEQAVGVLERALKQRLRPATRERLSFELGSILTHQLSDTARACVHWAAHVRSFPSGRYDLEIAQARESLGCPAKESR